jgi:hypothetical protein
MIVAVIATRPSADDEATSPVLVKLTRYESRSPRPLAALAKPIALGVSPGGVGISSGASLGMRIGSGVRLRRLGFGAVGGVNRAQPATRTPAVAMTVIVAAMERVEP